MTIIGNVSFVCWADINTLPTDGHPNGNITYYYRDPISSTNKTMRVTGSTVSIEEYDYILSDEQKGELLQEAIDLATASLPT